MRSSRLDTALRGGVLAGQSGTVVVFAPQAGDDLSALPRETCTIVTPFKPDFDHFRGLGFDCVTTPAAAPKADLAIVCHPRSRPAARDLLAQAAAGLRAGGKIVLDGQKTDGIAATLRDLADLGADLGEVFSKAHGKLAVFSPPPRLIEWRVPPRQVEGEFVTCVGIFSADGPDRASQLLAAALPEKLPARVADLGAGWGFLARAILARGGVKSLDLVEADANALDCARQNIADARAHFHWADATGHRPAAPWDMVVTNPPFHSQRRPDASLGLAFMTAAHRGLASHGQLWLVANRQLPYSAALRDLFREVEEFGQDPTFRLIRAAFPIRAR